MLLPVGARVARILLIAFQVWFLNVFVPGHTRGLITLSAKSGCGECCHKPANPIKSPTHKDQSECAVCSLAARITPPPVIDFHLTILGLRELVRLPTPTRLLATDVPLTYRGRAPPIA